MSDLISRRALIEVLNKNSIFQKVTNAEGKNVIEIINEQPTSYNVDKVVQKLEALANKYGSESNRRKGIEQAIEIVRQGGNYGR